MTSTSGYDGVPKAKFTFLPDDYMWFPDIRQQAAQENYPLRKRTKQGELYNFMAYFLERVVRPGSSDGEPNRAWWSHWANETEFGIQGGQSSWDFHDKILKRRVLYRQRALKISRRFPQVFGWVLICVPVGGNYLRPGKNSQRRVHKTKLHRAENNLCFHQSVWKLGTLDRILGQVLPQCRSKLSLN